MDDFSDINEVSLEWWREIANAHPVSCEQMEFLEDIIERAELQVNYHFIVYIARILGNKPCK